MSRLFGKGNNYFRQIGVGNRSREKEWREVIVGREGEKIRRIEAFGAQSGCVTSSGDAYTWGYNFDGLGMTKVMNFYKTVPIIMTLIQRSVILAKYFYFVNFNKTPLRLGRAPGIFYTELRVGSGNIILRDSTGQLYGVGDNRHGHCGIDKEINNLISEPSQIKFPADNELFVSQFDTGIQFTIVLSKKRQLYGFGRRNWRQYNAIAVSKENIELDFCAPPVACEMTLPGKVTHISAGFNHAVYIVDNTRAFCTGFNYFGQCGLSNNIYEFLEKYYEVELPLTDTEYIIELSSGMAHNVVLTSENRLIFWGGVDNNQHPDFSKIHKNTVVYTGPTVLAVPLVDGEIMTRVKCRQNRTIVWTDRDRVFIIGGDDFSHLYGLGKLDCWEISAEFPGQVIRDVALGLWHTLVTVDPKEPAEGTKSAQSEGQELKEKSKEEESQKENKKIEK